MEVIDPLCHLFKGWRVFAFVRSVHEAIKGAGLGHGGKGMKLKEEDYKGGEAEPQVKRYRF